MKVLLSLCIGFNSCIHAHILDGGIGDDVFSMGFDGDQLWIGGNPLSSNASVATPTSTKRLQRQQEVIMSPPPPADPPGALFSVGDVVGCCIDLESEVARFTRNGKPVKGHIKLHRCNDMITPAISFSSGVRYVYTACM